VKALNLMGSFANSRLREHTYDAYSNQLKAVRDLTRSTDHDRQVVAVPILSIQPGDSPRLNGEDKAHIARLAETETELPPILLDRKTMRVIDGMHRLMAASLQGRETVNVVFFDGSETDVFLRAVEENVTHGLPLSQADRRAAAERIIESHPQMSDRAIGRSTGLAAKTVAAIRRRSTGDAPQLNARIGRDGKIRPLDSGEGRRRAASLLREQPTASLRDVAREAGISPATVLDVRKRIERGEPPVPVKVGTGKAADAAGATAPAKELPAQPARPPQHDEQPSPALTVEKLLRDPSLRNSEGGRQMLRLLHSTAVGADQLSGMSTAVPPHCVPMLAQVARQYAQMWQTFATELNRRARVIDPTGQH
jgi:ParB-like chromosome segregation protein Spo0J